MVLGICSCYCVVQSKVATELAREIDCVGKKKKLRIFARFLLWLVCNLLNGEWWLVARWETNFCKDMTIIQPQVAS